MQSDYSELGCRCVTTTIACLTQDGLPLVAGSRVGLNFGDKDYTTHSCIATDAGNQHL